jgi:hypothetical protein
VRSICVVVQPAHGREEGAGGGVDGRQRVVRESLSETTLGMPEADQVAEQVRCPIDVRRPAAEAPESRVEQPMDVLHAPDERITDAVGAAGPQHLVEQRTQVVVRPRCSSSEEAVGDRVELVLRRVLQHVALTALGQQRQHPLDERAGLGPGRTSTA